MRHHSPPEPGAVAHENQEYYEIFNGGVFAHFL